ncbi:hypothetical protein CWI38_0159p0070 [Hamiltosporidium tvaerminnensis]|uniref:Lipoprotein n=1 Tax=Hamiltosporidium tvaerminnensis TaxID=1176355 RepID=A0A4Q9M1I8_9MICR|nr:hypothetical protein CWI38_0159p0070 [Hamiltosporidium tvaerminnensis]
MKLSVIKKTLTFLCLLQSSGCSTGYVKDTMLSNSDNDKEVNYSVEKHKNKDGVILLSACSNPDKLQLKKDFVPCGTNRKEKQPGSSSSQSLEDYSEDISGNGSGEKEYLRDATSYYQTCFLRNPREEKTFREKFSELRICGTSESSQDIRLETLDAEKNPDLSPKKESSDSSTNIYFFPASLNDYDNLFRDQFLIPEYWIDDLY